MRRRPLCVVLFLVIVWIVCINSQGGEDPPAYDGEERSFLCELEELADGGDFLSLLVSDVYDGKYKICNRMKLYAGEDVQLPRELHISNLLWIKANVYSFSKPGNPGQFNEFQYYKQQDISYKAYVKTIEVWDSGRDIVRDLMARLRGHCQQIVKDCCDPEEAGIVCAMLLGDKSGLSEETKKLYQENGIAHILAISGLHISLIGAGFFFLLRRYVMPMHMAAVTTVVFLLLYGTLTGFPVSTKRAVIMMICMLGARFTGKRYDLLSALSLSAIIQLLLHPLVLYQTGFLLSYGTVLGIALFVRRLQHIEWKKWLFADVWVGSLGIQMVTLPILLWSYYEISLYSVAVNIILLPLLGGILLSSAAGIGMGCWQLLFGKFCFGFVHYCLAFFDLICHIFSQFPFHTMILGAPQSWQVLLYYAVLVTWCLFWKQFSAKWHVVILMLPLVIICIPVHRVSGLELVNLDVGQGDCTCIRTEQETMLIDGGSLDVAEVGKYRIVPFLKSQGVSHLAYIFLTHSDADHTNGVEEILKDADHMGLEIGKLVLPEIQKPDERYQELVQLCERAGVTIVFMGKGDRISVGRLELTCLHPYASYDWQSENDYSLTLQLQYGEFSGLLTGDLEERGEKELEGLTHASYLKAGHHGSKGSSGEEFLEKVSPDIAVFSAGKKNRYGHPSPEAIERIQAVGGRTYCTIDSGAVILQTDGREVRVREWKNGKHHFYPKY